MKITDLLDAWSRERDVHFQDVDGCDMFVAAPDFIRRYFPDLNVVSFMEYTDGDLLVTTDSFNEDGEQEEDLGNGGKLLSRLPIGTKFLFMNHSLVKVQLSSAFNETSGCGFAFEPNRNLVWKFDLDHPVEVIE